MTGRGRRRWWISPLVLLGVVVAFFVFAPGIVERSLTKIEGDPLPAVSPRAAALHKTLVIADLHADSLLWGRDLLTRSRRGHVDLPRLVEGNVALQVFSSVTKTPRGQNYESNGADTDNITLLTLVQLQPPRTWNSLLERSLFHASRLERAAAASQGELRVIRSGAELERLIAERAAGKRVTGALLSIEGLQDLEGKLENLDRLYDAGFRMAGFAHFFDNDVAGSMHGEEKHGLTPLGREVLAAMEKKGMVVDIAHASRTAVGEILAAATRPVVSSHGGVWSTCRVNRNLKDDEIRLLAKTGGVVGIGYWAGAVCDTSPAAIARAVVHVKNLVGIEHVGLGSDFDGAVTTRFDTSELDRVTQALLHAGLSDDEIRAVMGGNVLRLLGEVLPKG